MTRRGPSVDVPSVDVLIAGAGPAGCAVAVALARSGRSVLLVDPRLGLDDDPAARPPFGESMPGAARRLLRDLGLLRIVERGPHSPSAGHASAWGGRHPEARLETRDGFRDPDGPGWRLDRARFDRDLRRAALEAGAIARAAHVRSIERSSRDDERGWHVDLGDGSTAAARWLVDATGRQSAVARKLGRARRRDDGLVALYAWAEAADDDRDRRTLVESTPDGWWYTALLPTGERVAGLHIDVDDAQAILRDPRGAASAWSERLERTAHVRVATSGATFRPPRAHEACGARLDAFAGDGWIAVGDAALSFDPLASQGLFNALYTARRAAGVVLVGGEDGGEDGNASTRTDALLDYTERLERVRAAYLHHHRVYYGSETRWSDRAFWTRRSRDEAPPRLDR